MKATDISSGDFCDLLNQVVAHKGYLVVLASIYIDESGTHDHSPIMSIGGFIFKKSKATAFTRKWTHVLKKHKVPFAHMTDLTHPKGTIFSGWSKDECLDFEKKLISITADYAEFGFAVSISERDYLDVYRPPVCGYDSNDLVGTAYTFLLRRALSVGASWAERSRFDGRMSYIFESGHKHQNHANRIIGEVMKPLNEKLEILYPEIAANQQRHRYFSHTFMQKQDAPPLQAADLLAWLWRNATMQAHKNKPERKDLSALRRKVQIKTVHLDKDDIAAGREMVELLIRINGVQAG